MTYEEAQAACAALGWELTSEDQSTEWDCVIAFTARDLSYEPPAAETELDDGGNPVEPHVVDEDAGCIRDVARTEIAPGSKWTEIDAARAYSAVLVRLVARVKAA